jgi:drug/metabolite transporter (DMT)-like permease
MRWPVPLFQSPLGLGTCLGLVGVTVFALTLPMTWWTWPEHAIRSESWWALAYVGVFSMWAGFFAWFRGLALGGALRVSQLQLLQPFLSIAAAVPLLGESIDALTVGFSLAVVATVLMGRRMNTPIGLR